MASFSKFVRPDHSLARGRVSERDLDIIETILRYRFSPTSELVRLVGGNEDVTNRRLRLLWQQRLVNRFAFPFPRPHSEFTYYLDNHQALDLLVQHRRLQGIHPQMEEELRLNRDADYERASLRGEHMKLGFLKHSLMISRLHFMLDMISRRSEGEIELTAWRQGAELRGARVSVPEIRSRRVVGSNDYVWEETDGIVKLPVEPDALFTARFGTRPNTEELVHFCYEADRGSMPLADMLKKLRAYHYFIKRRQQHKDAFGVHPIRAVLIETTDESRARSLMALVDHPLVIGPRNRSGLFWFTISPILLLSRSRPARYLEHPGLILEPIWALSDAHKISLPGIEHHPA